MGVPPNGWFIMDNPSINVDDECTPISGNLHLGCNFSRDSEAASYGNVVKKVGCKDKSV